MGIRDFIDNLRVPEIRRSLWEEFSTMNAELFENLADIARGREPRHLAKETVHASDDLAEDEEEPTDADSDIEGTEEEDEDDGGEA